MVAQGREARVTSYRLSERHRKSDCTEDRSQLLPSPVEPEQEEMSMNRRLVSEMGKDLQVSRGRQGQGLESQE